MFRTSIKIVSLIVGFGVSDNALAAGPFSTPLKPKGQKVCENTYNPGGTRCTTCWYTNYYPESIKTVCIKIKAPSSGGGASQTYKDFGSAIGLRLR
jgi:hypothetical protein